MKGNDCCPALQPLARKKGMFVMKFLPVRADVKENLFENSEYLPFILELLNKNIRLISDDYFPQDNSKLLDYFIDEINGLYPWFVVGISEKTPVGAAWVSHWHGGNGKYHSCQIHGCVDRKFYGKPALFALQSLVEYIFISAGVKRIQMEIPEFNTKAVNFAEKAGFVQEGLLLCSTLKNNRPLNHVILSKINNFS